MPEGMLSGVRPPPPSDMTTSGGSSGPGGTIAGFQGTRFDLPEVDTQLDPGAITAPDAVKADVATIRPPQDIDAATIGDYTPYTEVLGEVSPESTVEGRLSGLLSQNNPYIDRARTQASQTANRRGMLNSSMAAGAAEGAAIDRALPIAQQDARAHLEQQFLNQGYSNDAAKHLADASITRQNMQAGLEQQTRESNVARGFEASRLDQAAENQANTEYAAEQNKRGFAQLSADLQGQLKRIDSDLAMRMETLTKEYGIMENLDTIRGGIYKQMIASMSTILANESKASVANAKINALLQKAGVEMSFSDGVVSGLGNGEAWSEPKPAPTPAKTPTKTGGDDDRKGVGPAKTTNYNTGRDDRSSSNTRSGGTPSGGSGTGGAPSASAAGGI